MLEVGLRSEVRGFRLWILDCGFRNGKAEDPG